MTEEVLTDEAVRRFLLGDLDDAERQVIEGLFITDLRSKERILFAEEDLIEDYLENNLTASDRVKFLAQYGETPQQKRKLRITGLLKEYALGETAQQTPINTEHSPANQKWPNFAKLLTPRMLLIFVPVAAMLTIAIVIGAGWLIALNTRRTQEQARRTQLERELAELNTPSNRTQTPPQMDVIVVPPGSTRTVAPQVEIKPSTATRVVELRLLWTQKDQYPSYRAVLRRLANNEQFKIENLHLENMSERTLIRLRLPAQLLRPGLYRVEVSGISSDAKLQLPEEYNFMVDR